MSRTIPIALQTELDSNVTTLCYLLKITPKGGGAFGVTSLDVDFDYDDGIEAITYSSVIGLNQSAYKDTATLEVGSGRSDMLLIKSTEFNEQDIQNGLLDYAEYVLYRVDWKTPSNGHYIVSTGTAGTVETMEGVAGVMELRGISQQLKQTFIELYSLTCRAEFGSVAGGQIRMPCNFDADSLWENGVVLDVGVETDRTFTTSLPTPTGPNGDLEYVPGVVEFLTGKNAGAQLEIESYEDSILSLKFPTEYPIETGDTIKARPDCAKRYVEDCKDRFNNVLNFRGEYLIPLADEGPASTPGATYPGYGGGVVPGLVPQ